MGGIGSGRWQSGKALTTERMRLDIGKMQADVRLAWSKSVVVKLFVAKRDQLKGVFWALVRAPVCLG